VRRWKSLPRKRQDERPVATLAIKRGRGLIEPRLFCMPSEFPRTSFGGTPVNREDGGRGVVAASALPYSRGTSVGKEWRKSMWGRFGRRRTRRSQGVEQATNALQNVWGRFGEGRTGRKERAYGSAVWLGAGGVLAMATLILLLLWLLGRGRRSREETAPTSPIAEEDVEAVPPLGGVVPPAPPSAEDVSPREEPPPGEERPERRGETPTSPPSPREEPPLGEERPGGR
jgi:hypothetical protein